MMWLWLWQVLKWFLFVRSLSDSVSFTLENKQFTKNSKYVLTYDTFFEQFVHTWNQLALLHTYFQIYTIVMLYFHHLTITLLQCSNINRRKSCLFWTNQTNYVYMRSSCICLFLLKWTRNATFLPGNKSIRKKNVSSFALCIKTTKSNVFDLIIRLKELCK